MRRFAPALVAVVIMLPAGAARAEAVPALPVVEGPDVAPVTAPAAVITAFENERYYCDGSPHTRTVDIPAGTFNRIMLVVTITPDGDPWDRLIGVAINGVEVLRGTTPRTTMTLRRDITQYASLLPPGGQASVALLNSTYVGWMLGTVTIELYSNEPTAPALPPHAAALGAFAWADLNRGGQRLTRTLTFPATQPQSAFVDITLSGHGNEEFWFVGIPTPRRFTILVDGQPVAFTAALPYTYAFLGFGNEWANIACSGHEGTSDFGDTVHPVMWWTAQQGLDIAGVHTGNGEIPAYRAVVDPAMLPLLTGARTVEVVQENGFATWETSLSFLLD